MLERLRVPFSAAQVKQRPGGGGKQLDYVAIETVLDRLLTVAPDYSWDGRLVHFVDNTAVVEGTLSIGGKAAFGIGAMKNPDADMACKSANSEAMKNAAKNGFGIALELWDEGHRANLAQQRKLVGAADSVLKKEVIRIAAERLGIDKPSAADVAGQFGVEPEDLIERATLEQILRDEGLL